jgi:hypothetical protein
MASLKSMIDDGKFYFGAELTPTARRSKERGDKGDHQANRIEEFKPGRFL